MAPFLTPRLHASVHSIMANPNQLSKMLPTTSRRKNSRVAKIKPLVIFCIAVLIVGAVGFWWWQNGNQERQQKAQLAIQLGYEANGALENENFSVGEDENGKLTFGFDQALQRYEQIHQWFPEEELPIRNMAIARILMLKSADKQDGTADDENSVAIDPDEAKKLAIKNVQMLMEFSDSAINHWIQGSLIAALEVPKEFQLKIAEEYFQAATSRPDHAPFWFSVNKSIDEYAITKMNDQKSQALTELRDLVPNNLYVICKSLLEQATTKSADFEAYWNQKRPILEKANFSSSQYQGKESSYGDLSQTMDAIQAAIPKQDWDSLVRLMIDIDNSMRGKEPYKVDIQELTPNPLDYLANEFSDSIVQAAGQISNTTNHSISINFIPVKVPERLNSSPVLDMSLADVNFDGVLDAFLLYEDRIEVYAGPLTKLSDAPLMSHSLNRKAKGIHAAYLLMIADTGSGIERKVQTANQVPEGVVTQSELPQVLVWGENGLDVLTTTWTQEDGFGLTQVEQPQELAKVQDISSMVLLDFDQDGDLDVAVVTSEGIRFLINRANNTFVDATQWSFLPEDLNQISKMQIVDWDRDLYMDILVQKADGKFGILENCRHSAFRWKPLDLPFSSPTAGFAVAEMDGNASWDIVCRNVSGTQLQFTRTVAWSKVQWLDDPLEIQVPGSITDDWQVGDFDNSGTQDLLTWRDGVLEYFPATYRGNALSLGSNKIQFTPSGTSVQTSRPTSGDRGDLDSDGDLDLILIADQKLSIYSNEGGNQNNWLEIVPRGRGDNFSKTNHIGMGSLLEARIGQSYFAETVTRPSVHIGLGQAKKVDLARIIWSNGIPQVLLLPQGQQRVEMLYILKGSCPFIYNWDGQQWQFFSDCLWAAPIGLQSPKGGLVPTRNWEYLRMPPGSLVATDGTYRVMFTEELWEAAYFDHVRLQVIDHPADIEIQINDKVGPPSITQHRLYQVKQRVAPLSAVDQDGNDVLDLVLNEDQRYFKGFTNRYAQGFVEKHDLILDLGPNPTEDLTLLLTGWIQPTDTSINVLLQQHPGTQGPEFPSMHVIGEDGQWQPCKQAMGFPGGKTKTMSVPLAGLFPTNDHRLKISGSAEIYWDHIYTADTSEEIELVINEANLVSARTLHRGTSRRKLHSENGPELFDAADVTQDAVWAPMSGPFTAYGNVLRKLQSTDDELVVLGTGDAVQLHFNVPDLPTESGYKRTFLLYTVGYDKDADLNTVEGQDSRPMPYSEMKQYPSYARADANSSSDSDTGRQQSWHRFWHQVQNPMIGSEQQETKVPRNHNTTLHAN